MNFDMNFETPNQSSNVNEIPNTSNESQDVLANKYLSLHQKWTALMAEYQELLLAKDRNLEESGHMLDVESANTEYTKRMDEISAQMDECAAEKNALFDRMSEETKETYLKG